MMSTTNEIERRWVVKRLRDPKEFEGCTSSFIQQAYLEGPYSMRVRIYNYLEAEITRKTGKGLSRVEVTEPIPVPAAIMLRDSTPYRIEKTRFYRDGWELDAFHEELRPLWILEKEFASEEEALAAELPDWILEAREVTNTLTNQQLAFTAATLHRAEDVENLHVPKIVLTGPPCSGKSTFFNFIKYRYKDVHLVPEVATLLMDMGINPSSTDSFQQTVHRVQHALERGAEHQALLDGKKFVLLDRGTLDSAAFMENGLLDLEKVCGIKREDELARYDAVIMLRVPPKKVYDAHKANNPVRRETWEESKAVEEKTRRAWERHPRFVEIVADESWEAKVEATLATLQDLLIQSGCRWP